MYVLGVAHIVSQCCWPGREHRKNPAALNCSPKYGLDSTSVPLIYMYTPCLECVSVGTYMYMYMYIFMYMYIMYQQVSLRDRCDSFLGRAISFSIWCQPFFPPFHAGFSIRLQSLLLNRSTHYWTTMVIRLAGLRQATLDSRDLTTALWGPQKYMDDK